MTNSDDKKLAALKELQKIPGIGKSLAEDLYSIGIDGIEKLKGGDPEKLYDRLCHKIGAHVDRCVLYTFRCAVYYATETAHDPEKLKWWNWKDGGAAMDSKYFNKQ